MRVKCKTVRASRAPALAVALLGSCAWSPGAAYAFDLTGAWASDAELCKLVFARKADKIGFAELSDLYGSGFLADGNELRGKAAQCTIQSRQQQGDDLELSAACATTIMNQNVRFKLKIIDDDNVVRLFPEIEGMTLRYARCKL
jgi:hypothetical protein